MNFLKKLFALLFQMTLDVIVGMAIYFIATIFAPTWGGNTTLVVTLVVTAAFAEIWEVKAKKK